MKRRAFCEEKGGKVVKWLLMGGVLERRGVEGLLGLGVGGAPTKARKL